MSRARSRSASNSGSRSRRLPPPLGEAHLQLGQRLLQVGIGQRRVDIVLEVVRGRLHQRSPPVSPIGGLAHAGQHLGDVAHLDRAALALQLAGHVHQAAEIAGQQRVGAGRRDVGGLLADHGVGDLRDT